MQPCRTGGPDHQFVFVHRQNSTLNAVYPRRHHQPRFGKGRMEQIAFNPPRRLSHGVCDQAGHRLARLAASGRHIQHSSQLALGVKHGGGGAGEPDIGRQEMLVAMDGDGMAQGQRRANAICARR